MKKEKFGGALKLGGSILNPFEKKLVPIGVPYIPKSIETYHLTLTTILWSAFILVFSWLARTNIQWLWGVSVMILFQYITDLFDGAVGRYRDTGLVKWGFYMDHFLDYIFLASLVIGYAFIFPEGYDYSLMFVFMLFGGFMVHSYLGFAASNQFKISYLGIGPTEVRLIFIIINTLLIFFGRTYMAIALPYVIGFSLLGLCVVAFRTQKYLWNIDMEEKRKHR